MKRKRARNGEDGRDKKRQRTDRGSEDDGEHVPAANLKEQGTLESDAALARRLSECQDDEWDVERILDAHICESGSRACLTCGRKNSAGQTFYLVKWLGWHSDYDSWLPEDDLLVGSEELISAFRAQQSASASHSKKGARPKDKGKKPEKDKTTRAAVVPNDGRDSASSRGKTLPKTSRKARVKSKTQDDDAQEDFADPLSDGDRQDSGRLPPERENVAKLDLSAPQRAKKQTKQQQQRAKAGLNKDANRPAARPVLEASDAAADERREVPAADKSAASGKARKRKGTAGKTVGRPKKPAVTEHQEEAVAAGTTRGTEGTAEQQETAGKDVAAGKGNATGRGGKTRTTRTKEKADKGRKNTVAGKKRRGAAVAAIVTIKAEPGVEGGPISEQAAASEYSYTYSYEYSYSSYSFDAD